MVWQNKEMSHIIPTLALFALATLRLLPSITRVMSNLTLLRFCKKAVDVVYSDLNWAKEGAELDQNRMASKENLAQKAAKPFVLSNNLELNNIRFKYPNSTSYAIDEIDIKIHKGESVALIGPSGSGKTTLVDMILGLLEPTEGSILIDGEDVRKNLRSWRKSIGYIPQSIFLSDDTVKNNVAFGVPADEIDEAAVRRALRAAQLNEFVNTLPHKLETLVGERGVRLSGGQRQRIGIARALYHNPDILILDEATSSLDTETELEVTRAIEELSGEKTLILIAHRLSTAKKCQRIYKIAQGKIVAAGSFQDVVGTL
jgi:ABC-type multidrug transport system fused ATPase/permease subunit